MQQIHKIPGTTYAQGNLAPSGSSTPSWNEQDEISGGSVGGGSTAGDATFKAKMESLHDPMSTNLYMEGSVPALRIVWNAYIYIFLVLFYYRLPLSIDEPVGLLLVIYLIGSI